MTASAGAWYRVGTVNVTKNNAAVTGVGSSWQNDVIAIAIGDFFTLDAKTWYEVIAVNSDTSITLDRGFEGATGAGQSYAIVRNTSGTILTRIAGQVSVQFNQKQLFLDELRTWLNSTNASEELTDSHGLKRSLKTPAQMVADHDNRLAELDEIHPYPWAMRKVEFEANRKQNNEIFAASGFVHFGKNRNGIAGTTGINEGLFSKPQEKNVLGTGIGSSVDGAVGSSKTDHPVVNISGVITPLLSLSFTIPTGENLIKFTPAEDGTRTYDSATGTSVTHSTAAIAFASETATNKVVTDRVDMWGFEAFLREVNDSDPFVYAKGLIQSLAANVSGVTSVSDNVRPITYFAWYEGDESSRGKGVNWQTASEANRIKIASDPANNIYFDDETGKFYQWCIRGRSFAGAGNGDWSNLDASNPMLNAGLQFNSTLSVVKPQGIKEAVNRSIASYTDDLIGDFLNYTNTFVQAEGFKSSRGTFAVRAGTIPNNNQYAVNGQCYFLVCGTVNHLNQGFYHPSLNVLGSVADNTGKFWYNTTLSFTTQADCFEPAKLSTTISGRPDDRLANYIYDSGQGGVFRDMRYSAWGLKAEDFAEADLKIKSGAYRGRDSLTRILHVIPFTAVSASDTTIKSNLSFSGESGTALVIDTAYVYLEGKELEVNYLWHEGFGNDGVIRIESSKGLTTSEVSGKKGFLVIREVYEPLNTKRSICVSPDINHTYDLSESRLLGSRISVAGEYTHTEVIGDPANILLCDDLKDGWVGSWNPVIPDGATAWGTFQATRPVIDKVLRKVQTDNNGDTWTSGYHDFSPTNNAPSATSIPLISRVEVWNYKTKAKMTEVSDNSEVYGGSKGLGQMFATSYFATHYGAGLGFSLTGKTLTQGGGVLAIESTELNNKLLSIDGELASENTGSIYPNNTHLTLRLESPTNNGPAFKALNCNVVENQQGFINYAYTELTYDGTAGDWGDDGKIHIVDNQSTMLDTNGNTVKVGTARIVETLGWIKK